METVETAKQFFITQGRLAVTLLTGRWRDEALPQPGQLSFWGLGCSYLLTATVVRIAGVADAGPISALLVPLLWLGLAHLAGVYKNRSEMLPAFMHMAVAINLVTLASLAVGLDYRIYQWALGGWLYGATGYFFHKLSPGALAEPLLTVGAAPSPGAAEPVAADWKYRQWARNSHPTTNKAAECSDET